MADAGGDAGVGALRQSDILRIYEMQKGFDSMAASAGLVERNMAKLKGAIKGMPFVKLAYQLTAYGKSVGKTLKLGTEWRIMTEKERDMQREKMTILQKLIVPFMAYTATGKLANKVLSRHNNILTRMLTKFFGLFSILLLFTFVLGAVSLAVSGADSPIVNMTDSVWGLESAVGGLIWALQGEDGESGLKGALDVIAASLLVFVVIAVVINTTVGLVAGLIVLIVGLFNWGSAEADGFFGGLIALAGGLIGLVAAIAIYIAVTTTGIIGGLTAAWAFLTGAFAAALTGFALIIGGIAIMYGVAAGYWSDAKALLWTIVGYIAIVVGAILLVLAGIIGWPVMAAIAVIAAFGFLFAWAWRKRDELMFALEMLGKWLKVQTKILVEDVVAILAWPFEKLFALGMWIGQKLWDGKEWVMGLLESAKEAVLAAPGEMKTKLFTAFSDLARGLYSKLYSIFSFTIPAFSIAGKQLWGEQFVEILPNIPALAEGGIVTSPTLALIGEAGPEAVVPLSKGGGYGAHTFNISINVGGVTDRSDKRDLAMQISDEIQRELRRWGRGTTRRSI